MIRFFDVFRQSAQAVGWFTLLLVFAHLVTPRVRAADPQFVGILAELAKDDVAKQLGLSDDQRTQLNALIDRREEEVVPLALKIMDLPAAEQEKQLAPFRQESEKQGLALLDDQQRAAWQKIVGAGKAKPAVGLDLLGDPDIASKLKLSAEQQAEIGKLLKSRAEATAKASDEGRRRKAASYYNKKLIEQLQAEQSAAWEELTGQKLSALVEDVPAPADNQPAVAKTDQQPQPADAPVTVFPDAKDRGDGKLRFNFRFAPWKTVLVWFADQADLSLVANDFPNGTFNYKDNSRSFTPTEALDLINSQLLLKNYTLVQRGKQLTLINLDNGPVPKILVPEVSLADLDDKGDFELIRVLFPLKKFTPEEAKAEIEPLLGQHGAVVVLAKSKQIQVTEVAGRLRTIRDVITAVENPRRDAGDGVQILPLKFVTPEEVMAVVRPLMGFEEDSYALDEGALRIAIDALGTRLLVTGTEENITRLKEILKVVDVEIPQDPGGIPLEQPQLEVYAIKGGDPTQVLQVMQTLLAGLPDVRLAVDEEAGKLIALARREQHETIAATLKQLEQEGQQLVVIQLRNLDPQSVVLMINKLLGGDVDPKNGGNSNAPKVDADPLTGRLVVVGTKAQVDQIRDLLEQLDPAPEVPDGNRGSPRIIPSLTGYEARSALNTLKQIWLGSNNIRIVKINRDLGPGGAVQERLPRREELPRSVPDREVPNSLQIPRPMPKESKPTEKTPEAEKPAAEKPAAAKPPAAKPAASGEKTTNFRRARQGPFVFVHQVAAQADPKKQPQTPAKPAEVQRKTKPGAEIVAKVTPGGIVIASEDLDALDRFERLLLQVSGTASVGPQYTVFYLKYADATTTAEMLTQIFGGGGGGGGGSLIGDLARGALGGGGDLLGGLLGLGGGGSSLGSVQIVAEPRLNALIVQGSAADVDAIEQLLKVFDQKTGPEDVEVVSKPRLIPIFNTSADQVKASVEQVYHDRILASGGSGRQQQPSAEQFMRMLSRGRGGNNRGGAQNRRDDPAQKMKLGVDARTNSLIVIAPEPLFREVALLVEQLDTPTTESNQVITYTLHRSNPATVQKALSAIFGDSIQSSSATSNSSSSSSRGRPSTGSPQSSRPNFSIQQSGQFLEMIRRAREAGGQGGRGGDARGGDRGRGDRGRGGRR